MLKRSAVTKTGWNKEGWNTPIFLSLRRQNPKDPEFWYIRPSLNHHHPNKKEEKAEIGAASSESWHAPVIRALEEPWGGLFSLCPAWTALTGKLCFANSFLFQWILENYTLRLKLLKPTWKKLQIWTKYRQYWLAVEAVNLDIPTKVNWVIHFSFTLMKKSFIN